MKTHGIPPRLPQSRQPQKPGPLGNQPGSGRLASREKGISKWVIIIFASATLLVLTVAGCVIGITAIVLSPSTVASDEANEASDRYISKKLGPEQNPWGIKDFNEAHSMLYSKHDQKRESAILWIHANQEDIPDFEKQKVAKRVSQLLISPRRGQTHETKFEIVIAFGDKRQNGNMVKAVKSGSLELNEANEWFGKHGDENAIRGLIKLVSSQFHSAESVHQILIEIGKPAEPLVLEKFNATQGEVRTSIRRLTSEMEVDEGKIVDQCLKDIESSKSTNRHAVEWLARNGPFHGQESRIKSVVAKAAQQNRLNRLNPNDLVTLFSRQMAEQDCKAVADVVVAGKLPGPAGIKILAPYKNREAARGICHVYARYSGPLSESPLPILREMGPVAENQVLLVLESREPKKVEAAIETLKHYNTSTRKIAEKLLEICKQKNVYSMQRGHLIGCLSRLPAEPDQEFANELLNYYLTLPSSSSISQDGGVFVAYCNWTTGNDIERLEKFCSEGRGKTRIAAISRLIDLSPEKGIAKSLEIASQPRYLRDFCRMLEKKGIKGEPIAIQMLAEVKPSFSKPLLELLQKIGTRKSLSHLDSFRQAEDTPQFVKDAAIKAIEAIRGRNNR